MQDLVLHAKSYPFPSVERSYFFYNGLVKTLKKHDFDRTGLIPVLAAGSNQSAEQLARKYKDMAEPIFFPVQRCTLFEFDSVYAAHISSYGSIPSTFYPSPGTAVVTYILWLNDIQLERMHQTEKNYTFDQLDDLKIEMFENTDTIHKAYAYTSKVGCVNYNGSPISLSEIPAVGRNFIHKTQTEMLEYLRQTCSPDAKLDHFILEHIQKKNTRRERAATLSVNAIPVVFEKKIILEL
tara:strand:- start:1685 stop:2398 length:714 start_codon:yes stop_codon:yes gene_type:complete